MTEIIFNDKKTTSGKIDITHNKYIDIVIIKGIIQIKLTNYSGKKCERLIERNERLFLNNGIVSVEFLSTDGIVKYNLKPYNYEQENY